MKKYAIGCVAVAGIVIFILIIVGIAGIGGYNRLVRLSQGVNQQWAQVCRTITSAARI